MDYAFIPGHSDQELLAKAAYSNRQNCTVPTTNAKTVADFIAFLNNTPSTHLVGNILLVAHSTSEGVIYLPLYPGQPTANGSSYEDFQTTATTKSINVSDALLGQTATDPISHFVHIKGCNYGRTFPFLAPPSATPLMSEVQVALGGRVFVTAPKYFNEFYNHPNVGVFEYLALEFRVQTPTGFGTNRTAVVDAFDAAGFKFLDGSAVMRSDLEGWIPKRDVTSQRQTLPFLPIADLNTTIGGLSTLPVPLQFRVEKAYHNLPIPYPTASDVPTKRPEQLDALQTNLSNVSKNPTFATTHPFPYYVRQGFADLTAFMNGYSWTFTQNDNVLTANGVRTIYTLQIPILFPSPVWLFNFYPNKGSGLTEQRNFFETDTDVYTKV